MKAVGCSICWSPEPGDEHPPGCGGSSRCCGASATATTSAISPCSSWWLQAPRPPSWQRSVGSASPSSAMCPRSSTPMSPNGNGWDELIRQGYARGDIQAWSASSGTVVIPRAAMPPSPTAEASTRVSFSRAEGASKGAVGPLSEPRLGMDPVTVRRNQQSHWCCGSPP